METYVNYGSLSYSSFIDRVVQKKVEKLKKKNGKIPGAKLGIYFENANSPRSAGLPEYKCVMELDTPLGSETVVKKSKKFHTALAMAFEGVERILMRRKSKLKARRRA